MRHFCLDIGGHAPASATDTRGNAKAGLAAPDARHPRRWELLSGEPVWQELEAGGATIGTVPFRGRVAAVAISIRSRSVDSTATSWSTRSAGAAETSSAYALEGPIWDRFGSFAGQPEIAGTVVWTAADRRVVIVGRRGHKHFDELL